MPGPKQIALLIHPWTALLESSSILLNQEGRVNRMGTQAKLPGLRSIPRGPKWQKSGDESIWENEYRPQVERNARGKCAAEVQARGLEQSQVWRRDGIKQGVPGWKQPGGAHSSASTMVHGLWVGLDCWFGWLQRASYTEPNAACLLALSIG